MVDGVQFAGIASGIKVKGLDLGLVFFKEDMHVLSLYTRNEVKAAHILYNEKIKNNTVRALLVNSGCANACTGSEGVSDLRTISQGLSAILNIEKEKILFASTGVIGKRLPVDTVKNALHELVKNLSSEKTETFARSIMTTDTFPKIVQEVFRGNREYHITGVAKGAGMINPLFATMLTFVFTDYPVFPGSIKNLFSIAGKETFEHVSVDGECSTNDTVMLFTKSGEEDLSAIETFKEKLFYVMRKLSLMIVKDGEGATRVIHITVNGARKKEYAERIARRIATSPLTKTAFFGCDPNWGRIIAAAGDAGVPVNASKVEIILQGEVLAREGLEVPFDEQEMKKKMDEEELELVLNLYDGKESYDMYTTDFTYDYIKINASYRT